MVITRHDHSSQFCGQHRRPDDRVERGENRDESRWLQGRRDPPAIRRRPGFGRGRRRWPHRPAGWRAPTAAPGRPGCRRPAGRARRRYRRSRLSSRARFERSPITPDMLSVSGSGCRPSETFAVAIGSADVAAGARGTRTAAVAPGRAVDGALRGGEPVLLRAVPAAGSADCDAGLGRCPPDRLDAGVARPLAVHRTMAARCALLRARAAGAGLLRPDDRAGADGRAADRVGRADDRLQRAAADHSGAERAGHCAARLVRRP